MKLLRIVPVLVALAGCNGILGLDAAHVDPAISAAGAATAGSDNAGATSAEAGTTSDGGAGGAPSTPPTLCEQYCAAVTEGCTGDTAQYTDKDACLATCPFFPEGLAGDEMGNTVNCRLNYALKAPSEPVTYCTWAGPGGDGMCGTNCEGFCTLMTAECTAASTAAPSDYFASNDDCMSECLQVPSNGGYSATDPKITGGADTYECRLYHVAAAIYADDAGVHCPHARGLRLCVDK